jgi:hypothetical protein
VHDTSYIKHFSPGYSTGIRPGNQKGARRGGDQGWRRLPIEEISSSELGDDDDSPPSLFPLPHFFYVSQRNRFCLDAELTTRSQRPQLRKRLEDGCMRNTATAAPVKLDP